MREIALLPARNLATDWKRILVAVPAWYDAVWAVILVFLAMNMNMMGERWMKGERLNDWEMSYYGTFSNLALFSFCLSIKFICDSVSLNMELAYT